MSMLRYIEETASGTEILLFYGVRSELDVIFESDLERLRRSLPRFNCVIVASEPGTGWTGPRGRLSREQIERHLGPISDQTFFLCGPTGFMASVTEILTTMGVGCRTDSAGTIHSQSG